MRTVLHVLPHPGGGAETYIDLLEGIGGYEHRRVALSDTRSRRRGIRSVFSRRREVRRLAEEADLVHVHGDMAAMLVASGLRDRPLVITTHGLHRLRRSTGTVGRLVRRRLRAAVAASAATICIAGDERDDLLAALPQSLHDRLVLVANGVPVAPPADPERRRAARESLGLGEAEVGVLFLGRLEERKDPLGAIAAAQKARNRGADLVLLIAGGGPLAQEVAAQAGAAVRPLGHREDLDDLFAATDLFLLPSHREGMSFALLEAMAHGLAPVVADGTGNAETVGASGVVFPAGDLEAMSDCLFDLTQDADARNRLGAAARERIRNELSLERFLRGTREQYEAALGTRPPRQGA
ncbi:MAG TPA: glycosyltransferase family 4 protein [Solirubrobacterales bacterium]|nr:glycosyltransferase family 4 protein [Solirubrobacterales bacterium]